MAKKNLRAQMEPNQFRRFKSLQAELGHSRNDETIVKLMDLREKAIDEGVLSDENDSE